VVHFAAIFVVALWYVIAALWLILAFRTKRTAVRSTGVTRLLLLVPLAAIILDRPLQHTSLHHRIWAASPAISVVAVLLDLAGFAFAIWARLTIGTNWSGVVTIKENHELIQRGPYHFARHPIYTGLFAMGVAASLQFAEMYGFVLLTIVVAVYIPKVRLEEKLMTEKFPDQYPSYRQRVKAIIPFVL
jgi:protein-S-isoprenylcysteine O-methyltransferase Ste14